MHRALLDSPAAESFLGRRATRGTAPARAAISSESQPTSGMTCCLFKLPWALSTFYAAVAVYL
jgi:hypothetical protein